MTTAQGKPVYADHFVRFLGDGTAPSWPGARFDDARNWALLAAILNDGRAHISHIFVASPLRARLLEYAQKTGAPYAIRVHASEVMAQPRGALPHDDHFHVRISCPSGMERCIEQPTRNLARGRLLHARTRGAPSAPAHVAMANAEHEPATSRPSSPSGSAVHPPPRTSLGHAPEPSKADLPAIPASPDSAPPGALEAPIDDVDGVEETVE